MGKGKKLLLAAGAGALALYLFASHRGKGRRAKATYDDVTLAQKVSSELFVDPQIPKDRINLNAEDGVIVLRGEVDEPKDVKKIERLVKKIDGVEDVNNLLHLVGTPAPNK